MRKPIIIGFLFLDLIASISYTRSRHEAALLIRPEMQLSLEEVLFWMIVIIGIVSIVLLVVVFIMAIVAAIRRKLH